MNKFPLKNILPTVLLVIYFSRSFVKIIIGQKYGSLFIQKFKDPRLGGSTIFRKEDKNNCIL